jgi:hypothetical protein
MNTKAAATTLPGLPAMYISMGNSKAAEDPLRQTERHQGRRLRGRAKPATAMTTSTIRFLLTISSMTVADEHHPGHGHDGEHQTCQRLAT